jgi:hypothetical protein
VEALQKTQNRFRAMVEKSAEGILLLLPNKDIIYASSSVERVLATRRICDRPRQTAGRATRKNLAE